MENVSSLHCFIKVYNFENKFLRRTYNFNDKCDKSELQQDRAVVCFLWNILTRKLCLYEKQSPFLWVCVCFMALLLHDSGIIIIFLLSNKQTWPLVHHTEAKTRVVWYTSTLVKRTESKLYPDRLANKRFALVLLSSFWRLCRPILAAFLLFI